MNYWRNHSQHRVPFSSSSGNIVAQILLHLLRQTHALHLPYAIILLFSFITTFSIFLVEGLQSAKISVGILRSYIGPNLTDRERKSKFMAMYPLSEPWDFRQGYYLGQLVSLMQLKITLVSWASEPGVVLSGCWCIIPNNCLLCCAGAYLLDIFGIQCHRPLSQLRGCFLLCILGSYVPASLCLYLPSDSGLRWSAMDEFHPNVNGLYAYSRVNQ